MAKIKANYWKVEESRYKLQLRTNIEQQTLEEALPGWQCISYGYAPKTEEDIYVFEKEFDTEFDWTNFLKSDNIKELIEMKEVKND